MKLLSKTLSAFILAILSTGIISAQSLTGVWDSESGEETAILTEAGFFHLINKKGKNDFGLYQMQNGQITFSFYNGNPVVISLRNLVSQSQFTLDLPNGNPVSYIYKGPPESDGYQEAQMVQNYMLNSYQNQINNSAHTQDVMNQLNRELIHNFDVTGDYELIRVDQYGNPVRY